VEWKSSKIKGTISLSSTEAEINAIAVSVQRIMFMHPVMVEMGHAEIVENTVILEDNQACYPDHPTNPMQLQAQQTF
jgi:hypothetical protein